MSRYLRFLALTFVVFWLGATSAWAQKSHIGLQGRWSVALDRGDVGVDQKWFRPKC